MTASDLPFGSGAAGPAGQGIGLGADQIRRAATVRWARFQDADPDADPESATEATRQLVRFLIHPAIPAALRGVPDARALVRVRTAMRRVVDRAARSDPSIEAAVRHELALFLWENHLRLPDAPLREAVRLEQGALRLHRRRRREDDAARSRHLIGLLFRTLAHGGRVRDHERALRHLAWAAEALDPWRPDLAAEALFSSIAAWARRRIGDPIENHAMARRCWEGARGRFAHGGEIHRWLAADIAYAKALFGRRYARAAARDELIDLLGSVLQRLADLPGQPHDAVLRETERRLQIETLSLLGEAHRTRVARSRFAREAAQCFGAVEQLLEPTDHPDFAAPHRLRCAVFRFEAALAGQATWPEARDAVARARASAEASTDTATQLAATYWEGIVLAEQGETVAALARFEAVAAGRAALVGRIDDPFGIEARAEVASGLAAAGALAALTVDGPLAAIRFFEHARIGLGGRSRPILELEAETLMALCPPGGALVWLLMSRGHSAAIVAHGAGGALRFETLDLPSLDDARMRAGIARWLRAIVASGQVDPAAAAIGLETALDRLLADLGSRLTRRLDRLLRQAGIGEGAEIVLVTTGAATLMPIHAAPILGGRTWIDRYVLRTVPQLGFLAPGPAIRPARDGVPVILSDPERLGPAGVGEADRVADLFRHAGYPSPRIVERFRTPSEAVTLLDGARFLHITAHGRFGFGDPLWSSVILGDRQLGALHLAAQHDLHGCALAFLAACESALADPGIGADLLTGLAAGFLEAGAHTVIGALWPTADAPAALVVDGFYRRHLGSGLPPAQALRAAMLAARARFPHPFDWAPFLVHGR